MSKIQIIPQNLEFRTSDLFLISDFHFNDEKEATKINSKISSQREGSNSPGSFRFERTRKINSRVISKNWHAKSARSAFGLAKCECAHANKK